MQIKQKLDFPFKIKAVSETGEFCGYGSVFGVKDSYGDIVIKGAFEESLKAWEGKERMPAMLWMHDTNEPIGVYTKIEEDDEGLFVEGKLLIDDDPLAKRAHGHLKAGSLSGLSIGYNLDEYHYDSEKKAFILEKINLWEVSLVTFPANDEARVQQVKNAFSRGDIPNQKIVERYLREVMSVQQAKGFMSRGYNGINLRDVGDEVEHVKAAQSIIDMLKS